MDIASLARRAACVWVLLLPATFSVAGYATQVAFDLPETLACRDVTPPEFASLHPGLKVIEAKFRISARVVEGLAAELVDFEYLLTSPDKMLKFQDYLPNTTLESAYLDDQIEVTDASEKCQSTGLEAHVVYKPVTVGGSHSHNSKKSESSHYKQLAPKELVLASGTTNREHGVFFRLRPSRSASLEGAKEFTFLAIVPKTWRGDLGTISCTARAKKSSLFSTSVVPAGASHVQIGLYLAGDAEAAALADELRHLQDAYAELLAAHPPKDGVLDNISLQATGLLTGKNSASQGRKRREAAQRAVSEAEQRLKQLAR